jgi:hypothetical protein
LISTPTPWRRSRSPGTFCLAIRPARLLSTACETSVLLAEQDSGVASSLLNTAQQVGGAIGLALLGTVAWTTVADSVRTQVVHATAAAAKAGQPLPKPGTSLPASIYHHALTAGFSRAFLVAAGIALLALLIAVATIRVRRQDLSGAVPARQEAAPPPATVQQHEDRAALAAAARPCRFC